MRSSRGSEIQIVGAEKEKERGPVLERKSGTASKLRFEDRRVRLRLYGVNRSDRYEGRPNLSVLKVSKAILYLIRSGTGSQ